MKKNYLIGLGGSGGKVITELYKRLREEKGEGFVLNNVQCIAIDTDQGELNKLAELGVKKVCISGAESVGQMVNHLGDDVTDWCPDTADEGVFYSSPVYNGASQCRLKSRLCLASFLSDQKNALRLALEESTLVSPHGEDANEGLPTVLIVSSIAGGTGSGIFIQIALYIKKFFRKFNKDVKIHGLFACPELYADVVDKTQVPSLYANAYAVVRELNAFNLICSGNEGGNCDYDIDIEISSSCEGKLFEKDSEGRYGDKPYDMMYFINKINYLSKTLGGLDNYYAAMADIAYSHLYTDISVKVESNESNEMKVQIVAPGAIYGSAGASTLRYPYDDILEYFASRSIKDTVSNLWATLDKKWYNHLETKEAAALASGYSKYSPQPGERADNYIVDFEAMVRSNSVTVSEMAFLAPMVEKDGVCVADLLLNSIVEKASSEVAKDKRIAAAKENYGLSDINSTYANICSNVDDFSNIEDDADIFSAINDIDNSLDAYCRKSLEYVIDSSISFSNSIYCDNSDLWGTYDKADASISLVRNLLYNQEMGEWIHPVAARYLLYKFAGTVKDKIREIISGFDTASDDADDFYTYLVEEFVSQQKTILAPNDEELAPNAQILQDMISKPFKKRATKKRVGEYFENLELQLEEIDEVLADALVYFSLVKVLGRVTNLIEVYESFFDNIDDFIAKAEASTATKQTMHDRSTTDVFVCASADIKEYLYAEFGNGINTQAGATASLINQALFGSMRIKAAEKANAKKASKMLKIGKKKSDGDIFDKTLQIVVEGAKSDTDIKENLDIDVFKALQLEYRLYFPDNAEDIQNYTQKETPEAKTRIDQFIIEKFASLVKSSAPCLLFDCTDTYDRILNSNDEKNTEETKVSNSYRYISYSDQVFDSIKDLVGGTSGTAAVADFFSGIASYLPKDTENQSIKITSVKSDKVDKYSVLCYATVHCLQPYQISAFDELRGGEYYTHYAARIQEMEKVQKYSLTPHLDKRWHKHGVMPYINAKKERDHRLDLAKAFLYALTHGAIGYHMEGSVAQFVYADRSLGRAPELMFFEGKPIPYRYINRAVAWLSDNEDLVEVYSGRFEAEVNAEAEKLAIYSETVGGYKAAITNYARILRQMKNNIFRAVELRQSANGREKALKTKENISVLELAWLLHSAEESEIDKDYGELIVEMLCETIKEYAKAPYNARQIEKKNKESEAYCNYIEVSNHIADSFLDVFVKTACKKKTPKAKSKAAFGVTNENLTVNQSNISAPVGDVRFEWAQAEIRKHIQPED